MLRKILVGSTSILVFVSRVAGTVRQNLAGTTIKKTSKLIRIVLVSARNISLLRIKLDCVFTFPTILVSIAAKQTSAFSNSTMYVATRQLIYPAYSLKVEI